MDRTELKPIIEALIFASDTPLTVEKIKQILENVTKKEIDEIIEELQKEYQEQNRGFQMKEVANGYQLRTQTAFSPWLKRLKKTKPFRLTQPTLESLAIIAYRQPITRMEVEKIRGVDSGGVLKTLLDKKLISIVGKKDVPGKPFLFATTKTFLEVFGLENLASLPTLKDIDDLDTAHLPTLVRESNLNEIDEVFLPETDDAEEGQGTVKPEPLIEDDKPSLPVANDESDPKPPDDEEDDHPSCVDG
jgi:segregation and condensation protein B